MVAMVVETEKPVNRKKRGGNKLHKHDIHLGMFCNLRIKATVKKPDKTLTPRHKKYRSDLKVSLKQISFKSHPTVKVSKP